MRRYALILMLALMSCSRPDFDTSVQVEAWLHSLDPAAEVIEVWCTGNFEDPPGSGIWKEYKYTNIVTVQKALASTAGRGLDWDGILEFFIGKAEGFYSTAAMLKASEKLTGKKLMEFMMKFRTDDVRCDGKPLRSPPPIRLGKCPNDTHGCDDDGPPLATDLPPPLPPPPGGGDF